MTGVSFVIPVHNGERTLERALEAVLGQDHEGPVEVLVVDDRSRDASREILDRHARDGRIRVLEGPGRGAAAALNHGIRSARHELIAQVDQDVVLRPDWTRRLVAALGREDQAAAQGWYETDPEGSIWARVMGRDLEQRYARLAKSAIDHACTGNSIYRRSALDRVGGFDESLGYGYDVDLSYRLGSEGYSLVFCREARSVHLWREGLVAYLRQQYGVGYGRLDLIAKHPRRVLGDDVAPARMILHVPLVVMALGGLAAAAIRGRGWWFPAAILAALIAERAVAGVRAFRRFGDAAALLFPVAHLGRDLAWAAAVVVWSGRRLAGRRSRPGDSHASPSGP